MYVIDLDLASVACIYNYWEPLPVWYSVLWCRILFSFPSFQLSLLYGRELKYQQVSFLLSMNLLLCIQLLPSSWVLEIFKL